ncbi:MAG TPA: tetratricopeptide repeat protein, partial [Anaeromyxobacter sp.]
RDAVGLDREAAKALLAEAAAALPGSAIVRAAQADATADDPTLDAQVARARAEAALREALARDPGDAEARVQLAAILLAGQRLDEADEALAGLGDAASRPEALAIRARAADARGLAEEAEALVAEAIAGGGGCRVLDHGRELAGRRHAVALEDARARALAGCRDGREKLADHLRRHGDPAGAAEVLRPLVAARPWAVAPAAALSDALVAAGEPGKAADVLEALRAIWPRSARTEKALADARELAGDPGAARAARERALRLDGSDLGLRRALALEDGHEVLDDLAEDGGAAIRAYEAARRTDDTSSTLVLDAAAVELHPGGSATERTHQVIHVLDPQGVERHGEVSLPSGADVLTLRTHKKDGRTLEPERAGGGDKRSVSLAGLEPGDYVELEYLRAVRGDGVRFAADPFFFRAEGERLFRSTYVVAAPQGLGMEVDAHGMPAPPVQREGGRDVVRGLALDVPAQVPEPSSPPTTEYMPFLHVGVGPGLEALERSLADHAADRARPTEELRTLAREIRAAVGPGAAPMTLVRAAVARVSRAVLGQGGAFGEEASVVLSRGEGSRLVVLKALLAELGARVRIALARPFGTDPSSWRFPPSSLYGQPLLRVEAGGETAWLDPSLRVAPFGTIPSPVLDVEALLLPEPGEEPAVVRTPARAPVEERREIAVRIALDADGGATVEGEDRYLGAAGAAAKGAIERLDADDRRQVIESMLARSFRGVVLAEAAMRGEDDPDAPLVIRWRGKVPRLARAANGGLVLDAPILPARLGARFVQVATRTTPLLLQIPERSVERVEIVAPEGFAPVPASGAPIETTFGAFSRTDRVEGRTLVREERLDLPRGRVAPERYPEFAAFAAAVDAAQEQPLAVEAAAPAASGGARR